MFCLFPSNLHRNSENFKPNQVAKKTLWWERNMWLGGFLKENRSFLLLNVVLLYGNPAESISKPRKAAKEGFNLFSVSFDSTVEIQQTSHNWWRSNALFGHLKQQMLNDHCPYAVASQSTTLKALSLAIPPALSPVPRQLPPPSGETQHPGGWLTRQKSYTHSYRNCSHMVSLSTDEQWW